jgi:hypothetical protein
MSKLVVSQIEDSGGASLLGRTNAIINGNFGINQRGVSGTVTLAAGAYGHDRWKAGASGCTYTFATSGNVTTLTISAGSLIQVIEDINLFTGTYVLSWAGTAQGKIGAGSFGNSGITGSVTGGTNLNIEFGTGTVSLVKFEAGTVATPFEHRSFGQELALCQRYFEKSFNQATAPAQNAGFNIGELQFTSGRAASDNVWSPSVVFAVTKRAVPSVVLFNPAAADGNIRDFVANGNFSSSSINSVGTSGLNVYGLSNAGTSVGNVLGVHWTASAEL